ncbi:uncharacterized protein LOC143508803 [Brachyhypopomus gauderio]|uniref:uncharacterized protein LOC143508803 n=1 Tax=Brachyhypopomus gauderio TaxID=698409 RepID=UPI004041BD63
MDQNQCETPGQKPDVESVTLHWPVAPDGFVPNSVIRNWLGKQEPQETEDSSDVETLQDICGHFESKHLHRCVSITTKAQVHRVSVQDLRQVARDIMVQTYGIKHKGALLSHLRNTEDTPARQKLVEHLEKQLTEDHQLQQSSVTPQTPKSTPRLTRLYSPRPSMVDKNGVLSGLDVVPQYDDMSEQRQEMARASELHAPQSHGTEHLKPVHHARKKHKQLPISVLRKEVVQSVTEDECRGLIDPTTLALYKKFKKCMALPPTPSAPLPGDSAMSSESGHTANLVELPPTTRLERFRLEPMRGQGVPDWRESLHQLTSLHGFRSQKASKLAVEDSLSRLLPVCRSTPCFLPPVQASRLSLGQRVLEKVSLREIGPLQFHHIVPLPWQLNSHTLDHTGESQYGRLHVDWRAGCLNRPEVNLPPIGSKMASSVLPQGGSVCGRFTSTCNTP